ncbi:MAG: ECF transporter S component [Clostridiales bacterium]|nr:ECF transporter S component [Clostridiales bacterium]
MNTQDNKTKKLTMMAMLSALSYIIMLLCQMLPPMIPITPFLSYDAKDITIVIGGFIFGPVSAFLISAVVSVIEMFTVSKTGLIGLVMNIVSTCAFACTASIIYKRKHTLSGAVFGLITGSIAMTAVMVLWNYLLTPIYTGILREDVVDILVPAIIPFNLIKCGLNTAVTLLIYKPLVTALRKVNLIEDSAPSVASVEKVKNKRQTGLILLSLLLFATCILVVLALQGII